MRMCRVLMCSWLCVAGVLCHGDLTEKLKLLYKMHILPGKTVCVCVCRCLSCHCLPVVFSITWSLSRFCLSFRLFLSTCLFPRFASVFFSLSLSHTHFILRTPPPCFSLLPHLSLPLLLSLSHPLSFCLLLFPSLLLLSLSFYLSPPVFLYLLCSISLSLSLNCPCLITSHYNCQKSIKYCTNL